MKKILFGILVCLFGYVVCIQNTNAQDYIDLSVYAEYNNPDVEILEKGDGYIVEKKLENNEIYVFYIEKEKNSNYLKHIKEKYSNSILKKVNLYNTKEENKSKKNISTRSSKPSSLSSMISFSTSSAGDATGEGLWNALLDWITDVKNYSPEYIYKDEAKYDVLNVWDAVKPYNSGNGWHKFNLMGKSYWALVQNNKLVVGWHYDNYYKGWYFFFPNGIMMDGKDYSWIKHKDKWYEFESGGKLLEHSGWRTYNGKKMYHLPGDYGALSNCRYRIGNKTFDFDKNGYSTGSITHGDN